MRLDNNGISGLSQNLQQIIISDEVEPGERTTFLLQELVQRLLASVRSCHGNVHVTSVE